MPYDSQLTSKDIENIFDVYDSREGQIIPQPENFTWDKNFNAKPNELTTYELDFNIKDSYDYANKYHLTISVLGNNSQNINFDFRNYKTAETWYEQFFQKKLPIAKTHIKFNLDMGSDFFINLTAEQIGKIINAQSYVFDEHIFPLNNLANLLNNLFKEGTKINYVEEDYEKIFTPGQLDIETGQIISDEQEKWIKDNIFGIAELPNNISIKEWAPNKENKSAELFLEEDGEYKIISFNFELALSKWIAEIKNKELGFGFMEPFNDITNKLKIMAQQVVEFASFLPYDENLLDPFPVLFSMKQLFEEFTNVLMVKNDFFRKFMISNEPPHYFVDYFNNNISYPIWSEIFNNWYS